MEEGPEPPPAPPVVCPAAKDPAVRLFIVAVLLLGFGAWCLTDLRPRPRAWDLDHINEVANYLLNNWGPVLFFPAGVVFAVWGVVFLRRTLVADTDGIGYKGRDRIAWSDVKGLDTSQFAKKSILKLQVERGGERDELVLDGWKLQNFKALVRLVESKLPQEVPE